MTATVGTARLRHVLPPETSTNTNHGKGGNCTSLSKFLCSRSVASMAKPDEAPPLPADVPATLGLPDAVLGWPPLPLQSAQLCNLQTAQQTHCLLHSTAASAAEGNAACRMLGLNGRVCSPVPGAAMQRCCRRRWSCRSAGVPAASAASIEHVCCRRQRSIHDARFSGSAAGRGCAVGCARSGLFAAAARAAISAPVTHAF